jgi:hypothetical protein
VKQIPSDTFHERNILPLNLAVINTLNKLAEFVGTFELNEIKLGKFITYIMTKKILSQFVEAD